MTTGAGGRVAEPAGDAGGRDDEGLAGSRAADSPRRDHEILLAVALTARLFRVGDIEAALDETLAALGRAAGVTRAFLFDIVRSPAGPSADLTHEWTAPGIPSLIGNPILRSFMGGADTSPMAAALDAGRAFVLRAAGATDRLRALLESIGSRTVLIVPVEVNGARTASIGFEDSLVDRAWNDDEVGALVAAAGMIGAAIGARRTAESLRNRDAILEAVADAGERFMRGGSVDEAIADTIARLGDATHSSRVVLVERRRGADRVPRMLARHAWAASGVRPLAAAPDPIGFAYFPRWEHELATGRIIAGDVVDFPAEEQVLLGGDRVHSIVIAPVVVGGRWWGHLGFDDSVTERTWSALEIDALRAAAGMIGAGLQQAATTDAVAAAHDRLRDVQRMDAVGRLAGGLAHDFNNVLTVVSGHARYLLDGARTDEARADAQAIIGAAQGGTELTRQLLDFSRKRIEELAPVDLGALIERSRRTFERLVGPSVGVKVVLAPGLPPVLTDAAQFVHVLVNLVSNARDAMPDGGTLTISAGAAADGASVDLVIRDTGIGMDAATQARIFEPLFTTKPSGRGTGFGLAIAAAVVAGSGGRITVTSAPKAGATFTIRLPVAGGSPGDHPVEPA